MRTRTGGGLQDLENGRRTPQGDRTHMFAKKRGDLRRLGNAPPGDRPNRLGVRGTANSRNASRNGLRH
jgi:hypothetical protein